MGNFPGGSAFAMARDISDGYVLVTERTFLRFAAGELDQLSFELDRLLRDLRGDQPPLDDIPALQLRNRKIQRVNQATVMLKAYQAKTRRVPPPTPPPGAPKKR